jgi:hypothetical protein
MLELVISGVMCTVGREGENILVEGDMATGIDTAGFTIQTTVAFLFLSIANKNTRNRTGTEFVRNSGRKIGVT